MDSQWLSYSSTYIKPSIKKKKKSWGCIVLKCYLDIEQILSNPKALERDYRGERKKSTISMDQNIPLEEH